MGRVARPLSWVQGRDRLKDSQNSHCMLLTILSWNIHKGIGGLDRRYRLTRVADVINDINPDIALLQEVADHWPPAGRELQGERLTEMTSLRHLAFAPEHRFSEGGYGNAVLSRYPIIDTHRVDLKIGWRKQRSALQALIRLPDESTKSGRKILATSLHLGLAEGERRKQLSTLLEHNSLASSGSPTVLGGDFNDVFGSLSRKFPESYSRAGKREVTFPAALPVFCLDGIWVSGLTIRDGCVHRGKGCRFASDHLPLVAKVELNESNA